MAVLSPKEVEPLLRCCEPGGPSSTGRHATTDETSQIVPERKRRVEDVEVSECVCTKVATHASGVSVRIEYERNFPRNYRRKEGHAWYLVHLSF